jgi:hypothetical protein
VKSFGLILAIWVLSLAALFPMAGAYATYVDLPSPGAMMRSLHEGMGS